jgi:O-antigen/teichoic acid export membrane protein
MLIAKRGAPEMVGEFTLGLAITAPVFLFSNLALRTVQSTDARSEYSFSDYLQVRLFSIPTALAITLLIAGVGGYGIGMALVLLAVGVAKAVEAISDIYYGRLQQHERMDRIAKSLMLRGLIAVALVLLVSTVVREVVWIALAMAVAWASVLVLYDLRASRGDAGLKLEAAPVLANTTTLQQGERGTLWRLVAVAAPLGFVAFLISLVPNIPRYILEYHHGTWDLGIYGAIAYVLVAANLVVNALGQSATPRLAKYFARGDYRAFQRLLVKLTLFGSALGFVGVAVAILLGRPLLALLYTQEYASHNEVFIWIMIAGGVGFVASFLWYGVTAARAFRVQVPLFASVIVAVVGSSLILVPQGGAVGAAQALLIGMLVQVAGTVFALCSVARSISLRPAVSGAVS